MRRALVVCLIFGVILFTAGSALAEHVPWLSVTPWLARAGDTVVFTLTGPPGYEAALAYSFSSLGFGQLNGQHVLLGPDLTVLASGTVGPGGAFTSSVQIPPGVLGEVFLQGAVWSPESSAMTLTNGTALYITGGGRIAVADVSLGKKYGCESPTTVEGIEFRADTGAFTPIREATMQTPTGTTYRMRPFVSEGPPVMTPSGYPYIFEFGYDDQAGETNLSLFPDGTYTFTATFPDGTTATATAVLGGAFPSVPTFVSPACGAMGVSRGPTIQFTASGAARFEVGVSEEGGRLWYYSGTATTVTVPSNLLWPSAAHGIRIDAYAQSATDSWKSTFIYNSIMTGP